MRKFLLGFALALLSSSALAQSINITPPGQASTTAVGVSRYSTSAEAIAGTNAVSAVTPSLLPNRAAFRAHKGGSAQTGIVSATPTAVTFGTEVFDVGSSFASNTWTPPAGAVEIGCSLSLSGTLNGAAVQQVHILKNGAAAVDGIAVAIATAVAYPTAIFADTANGTDAYTCQVELVTTAGTGTVSGSVSATYFWGVQQ